jgi:phosphatidylglycerol lysyltransferase
MRFPETEQREKWAGILLGWGELFLVLSFIAFRIYATIQTPSSYIGPAIIPVTQPERAEESVNLQRGPFKVWRYTPGDSEFAAHPKAVIIFGSGDGGFDGWEDRVCKALQADGYTVIGFDCAAYAKTDYDLATLQADFDLIGRSANAERLILGGWSMGAEQAVAAAGGPDRPANLLGLLLISPGDRGRYGLREADRWDVPPTGSGTFALADFATKLTGLRVAQWDGKLDLIGSTAWLDKLTVVHKVYRFEYGLHNYDGASGAFLSELKKSVTWVYSGGL